MADEIIKKQITKEGYDELQNDISSSLRNIQVYS